MERDDFEETKNHLIMKTSLKNFMSGIIDYAGLFPPAKLDMDTSIHNFATYRKSTDSALLSAFICPADRLTELEKYESLFQDNPPFYFSVLCSGGNTLETYADSLLTQLNQISHFTKKMGRNAIISALEIKLPPFNNDVDSIVSALNEGARLISAAVPDEVNVFYETVLDDDWKKQLETLTEAIAIHNKHFDAKTRYLKGGLKVRCGGVEAHMFPSAEVVTEAVYLCNLNHIPLKATAGLHHPVRHFNDSVQTKMHGFFNVFGASILAHTHSLTRAQITEIIEDEDIKNFRFNDHYFSWKKLKATPDQITNARLHLSSSFGSCSFDEPREDLQKAGYM
jgi:hypothetical protein